VLMCDQFIKKCPFERTKKEVHQWTWTGSSARNSNTQLITHVWDMRNTRNFTNYYKCVTF
jgi:hypothetical protein